MGRGGRRPGAGRKKSPNSRIFHHVGLTAAQWEYLELWFPGGIPSDKVAALLDRAVKFWPAGPNRFRTPSPPVDKIDESDWVQTTL